MTTNTFIPIALLAVAVILAGIVNMQQDTKIKDLTARISTLEQTK